ncbi:isopenicillin N synthase family dioxygenase [Streptomyces sp. 900105755]|uniref:isopenicillin N synthase family dioxygenase n=1 Tax=unclassified Streptomyces TaxID=2593676 RepID=UPI00089C1F37|nr:2-oxoglutarate and iron-dependent oxygenase domain-containing protein [Streptomyces sp. Ag109_O5-10]SEF09346.1 Isopenicillin N synthase [Streptomyces sp. Ag109_O5-10]
MPGKIPEVDLEAWHKASDAERALISAELDAALRNTGMFLASGHGVPRAVIDDFRDIAKRFFALRKDVKARYAIEAAYDSGWLEMHPPGGVGVPVSEGEDAPSAPDLHESFYVGPGHRTGDEQRDRFNYPANRWPVELPELRVAAEAYTTHMVRVVQAVNEVLAVTLGLPEDFFTSRARRATWTQNASWYPSYSSIGEVARGQFRNGPHTDLGTVTLLSRQRGVGGLQAWDEEGWFSPPYSPDSLIVNLGDLMERWTDGRWRALKHRVLPPSPSAPDEELLSLVFFFETDPDTLIEPLAAPIGGGRGMSPVYARRSVLETLGVAPDSIPGATA